MFKEICKGATETYSMTVLMNFVNKTLLLVGFGQYYVAWDIHDGEDPQTRIPKYKIIPERQLSSWLIEHLGYKPVPEKISGITIDDLQNAPGKEPLRPMTLAQIQKINKQQGLR